MIERKLSICSRRVEDLISYDKNARTHSDEQVREIAASISEFGWTNPILIDEENRIIAGHGRLLAAQTLKQAKVPCAVLQGLSDTQKRAYALADNKLPLNAGWNDELLSLELKDIMADGFNVDLTGFTGKEVESLLNWQPEPLGGETDAEEAPPAPVHPTTAPGEVWILGKHRIVCGDSRLLGTVQQLLGDVRPLLMVTDTPTGWSTTLSGAPERA